MGIVNVTPDSFYDGGSYLDKNKAIDRALQMIEEGADIIDIGGESTRPGSDSISASQEIDRILPVIEVLNKKVKVPISVDTYKSEVVEVVLQSGANIINDISGLTFDPKMGEILSAYKPGIVLMHIKGTPKDMQNKPNYSDLLGEIFSFLEKSVSKAVSFGLDKAKIIIDPGVGFGKTLEDNYRIIRNLEIFKKLGVQLLIGLSRKSLIGNLYQQEIDRLPGTIALNTAAILNGADIIRVHDVKEHRLALDVLEQLNKI